MQGDHWVLDAHQLLLARELGIIEKLPRLSEDHLDDHNKGGIFVKLLALGQVFWFGIQLVVRLSRHIHTTQLEILTLAFATCTFMTYILLLDKPKDVQTSLIIPAARYATLDELIRLAVVGPRTWWRYRRSNRIPNNTIHFNPAYTDYFGPMSIGVCLSLLIFGVIHVIAWNFVFPTRIERLLWKTSTLITTFAIPVWFIFSWTIRAGYKFITPMQDQVIRPQTIFILGNAAASCAIIFFALARLYILVEVLRSLAFLPSDAFATTWSGDLPHLG